MLPIETFVVTNASSACPRVRSVPLYIQYPDHELSRVESILQTFMEDVVEYAWGTKDDDLVNRYNSITNELVQLWHFCVNGKHEELRATLELYRNWFRNKKDDVDEMYELFGALCSTVYVFMR